MRSSPRYPRSILARSGGVSCSSSSSTLTSTIYTAPRAQNPTDQESISISCGIVFPLLCLFAGGCGLAPSMTEASLTVRTAALCEEVPSTKDRLVTAANKGKASYTLQAQHVVERKRLCEHVVNILENGTETLVVHGARRSGKTGILQQAWKRMAEAAVMGTRTLTVVEFIYCGTSSLGRCMRENGMEMTTFCESLPKTKQFFLQTEEMKNVLVIDCRLHFSNVEEWESFLRECQRYQEKYSSLRIVIDLKYPLSDVIMKSTGWMQNGAVELGVDVLSRDIAQDLLEAILEDAPSKNMRKLNKLQIADLAEYACDKITDYTVGNIQFLAKKMSRARGYENARNVVDRHAAASQRDASIAKYMGSRFHKLPKDWFK